MVTESSHLAFLLIEIGWVAPLTLEVAAPRVAALAWSW
jgi:hypothetical protein